MYKRQEIPCKKYLGVKIFRTKEMLTGTNWRTLKDGTWVPAKPKYLTCYSMVGGYPEDTIQDCKESIQNIWDKLTILTENTADLKEFALIMNEE